MTNAKRSFSFFRLALSVLLLSLCGVGNELVSQGFEISFGGNKEDEGRSIIQTIDHGFLAIGYSESFGDDNDEDIYLIRTDVDGRLVWEKTYDEGFNEQAFDAVALEDGGFIVVGFREAEVGSIAQVYLMNLDKRGNIRWTKTYENMGVAQRGNHIIKTSNRGYLLTGTTQNTTNAQREDILLIKVDADGAEEWRQTYGNGRLSNGVAAIETEEGFLFAANMQGTSGPDRDIFFYRIDKQGGLIDIRTYGEEDTNEEVNDIIPTSDGNFAFVGSTHDFNRALIGKADLNGDTLWYTELEITDFEDILNGIVEAGDGSLTAAGYSIPIPEDIDMLLVHTTSNGQLLWQQRLGERGNTDTGTDLALTVDGGYALIGFDAQADISFINDLVVFKVDGLAAYRSNRLAGRVFVTTDGCNAYTEGDAPLEDWIITASTESSVFYGTTDSTGQFDFLVPQGEYVVELVNQNESIWSICDPSAYLADFSEEYDTTTIEFPVTPLTSCPVLEVAVDAPPIRSCSPAVYTIRYENSGSDTARNAYVDLTLDTELTFVDAGLAVDTVDAEARRYRFLLNDLSPGTRGSFELQTEVACTDVLPNQAVVLTAEIFPDTLCGPADPNWDGSSIAVSAECLGTEVQFSITNTGVNPITESTLQYVVVEDFVIGRSGPINPLGQGGIQRITVPVNSGSTYRIIAEQATGHPGRAFPTVAVEGCTFDDTYTTGIVTDFSENDGDLFIDINVQEVLDTNEALGLRGHPAGYQDSIVAPQTDLQYTLFFVNSGTDTVDRVVIRDTLPTALDVSTLQLGAASHPYVYEVYDNGILRITFDSIFLSPDGGANTDGFVQFKLSQKPGNPIGTIIENRAAVYFANVAPTQTNVVSHTVGCTDFFSTGCIITSTEEPDAPIGLDIQVAPNPVRQQALITVNGCTNCEALLFTLYDATGRRVRQEAFSGQQLLLERAGLPAGPYFFELRQQGKPVANGQLFVR